tara:strand:+ start:460 stop:666 length:207 start_codon:yes stop_codon:yes gene_type:complete
MYLDETILQSRTTLTLVEFIDELMEYLEEEDVSITMGIMRKYHDIKGQSDKARAKRSKLSEFKSSSNK